MNITKNELSELSQSLNRSKKTSPKVLEYLNALNEHDFNVAIAAIKDFYGWEGYNNKIIQFDMLQTVIMLNFKDQMTADGLKKTFKHPDNV